MVEGVATKESQTQSDEKRQKRQVGTVSPSFSRECENAVENCATNIEKALVFVTPQNGRSETHEKQVSGQLLTVDSQIILSEYPKFGVASVCGRRRDMEDAVAIHPWFCKDNQTSGDLHYFGVYDGHGCSHV